MNQLSIDKGMSPMHRPSDAVTDSREESGHEPAEPLRGTDPRPAELPEAVDEPDGYGHGV